jgi:hypothetical protein
MGLLPRMVFCLKFMHFPLNQVILRVKVNDNLSSDCMIISGLSVPANCLDDPMVTSETAFSSIDLMGCNSKFTTVESILNFCLPFDAKL